MIQSYLYILFNQRNGALYVGVTSDLIKRVWQHKTKRFDGFTKKYNIDKLGYYEVYQDIKEAIKREKQLKAGSRLKKMNLIEKDNSSWSDLYDTIL
ncbi:MAG: GIY-YIG nuclease family protein [Alphaproteobacteria bacterium]